MTVHYTDTSREIRDQWPWLCAVDAFDHCHPDALADLIRAEPIPEPLRPVVAAIVAGQRKPNKRAAARLKIPASERMRIAGSLSAVLGLIDVIKRKAIDSTDPDLAGLRGVSMLAACPERGQGREPVEILRELEAEAQTLVQDTAQHFGVSIETVENLLRDMRAIIAEYPNV